jgi:hypothetical protein
MATMGYADFVRNEVANKQINAPFTADELTTQAAVHFGLLKNEVRLGINLALKRLTGEEILRLSKGVYYRPKRNIFGLVPISLTERVYHEYVETDEGIIGYITGLTLCQKLGFTTQIPRYKYFATNAIDGRDKLIEDAGVILRPTKTKVSEENYRYLQILDVIDNKDGAPFEVEDVDGKLAKTIKRFELDYARLIGYAKMYYAQKVIAALINIAARYFI